MFPSFSLMHRIFTNACMRNEEFFSFIEPYDLLARNKLLCDKFMTQMANRNIIFYNT